MSLKKHRGPDPADDPITVAKEKLARAKAAETEALAELAALRRECSRKARIITKMLDELAARDAITQHLTASPYHNMPEDEAMILPRKRSASQVGSVTYSKRAIDLVVATMPMDDGIVRLHELTQQDTFEPAGGIFYVNKRALDFVRQKREQNKNVHPLFVKELVAIGSLEDSVIMVPVDFRSIDCEFGSIESMIAKKGPNHTADHFLDARKCGERNFVGFPLCELPRELTVGELKRLWKEGASGGDLKRLKRDGSPSAMRCVLRFFYDRLTEEMGASHETAKVLIMADINALLEEFSEDSRARCGQPEGSATAAVVQGCADDPNHSQRLVWGHDYPWCGRDDY